jgi:hypothetical protein
VGILYLGGPPARFEVDRPANSRKKDPLLP